MIDVLSVVIPIYRLDSDRLRNLSFVYNRLIKDISEDHLDLIFCIQAEKNEICDFDKFDRARKQIVRTNSDKFYKSKILNYGGCCSTGQFILFLDADIHFNFKKFFEFIKLEDEVIKPFWFFIKLDEDKTIELIERKEIRVKQSQVIEELGAGAICVRKDVFETTKFNEQFVNWGWEDLEYAKRLRRFKVRIVDQKSVHLYHKPQDINLDDYYKNRLLMGNIKDEHSDNTSPTIL